MIKINKILDNINNLHFEYLNIINEMDFILSKKIKLKGKSNEYTIVSQKDYNILSKYNWFKSKYGYVVSKINGKNIRMHRIILNVKENDIVDHINGNRLDNRETNLRITNLQLNGENKKKTKLNATSKYLGVCYHKQRNKYISSIRHNNKRHYLGIFKTEIEAAECRDIYIVRNKLDHLTLNFPEKKNIYQNKECIYDDNNKSKKVKYFGVQQNGNNYKTEIYQNHKKIFSFISKNPLDCAINYDNFIVENNLLNKKLNFPEKHPDYSPHFNKNVIMTSCFTVNDKIVKLNINPKEKEFLIDKEDYEMIKYYTFTYNKSTGYLRIRINGKEVNFHRYLMNIYDPKIFIDHIDGNKLNNSKSNLRISNAQKNSMNRNKKINSKSKYFGISPKRKSWTASFTRENKKIFEKTFKSEEEAARYRDLYIITNYPDDHYKLNFEWTPEDINLWKEKQNLDKKLNN